MKRIAIVTGLGLLLAGCAYGPSGTYGGYSSNGYYGYSAVPTGYSVPYGSHGWPGSSFNGGDGPGTPGVGSGG